MSNQPLYAGRRAIWPQWILKSRKAAEEYQVPTSCDPMDIESIWYPQKWPGFGRLCSVVHDQGSMPRWILCSKTKKENIYLENLVKKVVIFFIDAEN